MTALFLRPAACGLLLLAALPAHAAPASDAIAGMLAAAVAATGEATLTYDGVSTSGDVVTLSGVKVTTPGGSIASVPALVVSGAAERQPGGFTATHIEFDQGSLVSHGDTTTWGTASLDGVVIPSADEVKARAKVRPFKAIAATGIVLSGADFAAPIEVVSAGADIGDLVDGAPTNVLFRASGVKLKPALLSNSFAGAMVAMLDYDEIVADVVMDSEYDTKADTVTVHLLSFEAPNFGKVTLTGKASGLSLKGLTDKAKAKDARAAARLDSASVRLDNGGVVERMLDMQAEMLGGTRDDVRSQLVDGALPFALGFVKNAAFRDQFMSAAAVFLKDPHSLTIVFTPPQPVPLGEVMRTAARSPTALPDLLSPTVEANH